MTDSSGNFSIEPSGSGLFGVYAKHAGDGVVAFAGNISYARGASSQIATMNTKPAGWIEGRVKGAESEADYFSPGNVGTLRFETSGHPRCWGLSAGPVPEQPTLN